MITKKIEEPLPQAQPVGLQAAICQQCRQLDRPVSIVGAEPEHFVKPEIRFIDRGDDKPLARRYVMQGWKVVMCQGRLAVERMICVDCLNSNALRDSVADDMRECQQRAQKQDAPPDNFYLTMCEQD